MATLAIGLIVYEIAIQWQSVTQGYMGISGIAPLGIGGYEIVSDRGKLFALVVIVGARQLGRRAASRLAVRPGAGGDRRQRGCRPRARHRRCPLQARWRSWFRRPMRRWPARCSCTSSSSSARRCSASTWSCCRFTMLYVGGIGTLGGPVLGAVIVSLLPEIFRGLKDYQDLFYGAGLIAAADLRAEGPCRARQHLSRGGAGHDAAVPARRDAAVRRA